MNWNDAKAYTDWMTARTGREYRLPTEAEREFATRAGTTTLFWWGNEIAPRHAAYDWSHVFGGSPRGEALRGTVPVADIRPEPVGPPPGSRQRIGMGRRLLERQLSLRTGRWSAWLDRRLPATGAARRVMGIYAQGPARGLSRGAT